VSRSRIGVPWGAALLCVASLAVSLVATEVVLRVLGHHGAPGSVISNIYVVGDPILDWRYVPNSERREGRVEYRYNAAGFRDRDHAIEKPPGTFRLVVIGDSVAEGFGVEWPGVFASLLQSRLGPRCEVINVAASGLNTPQEVHLLEQVGLRYGPDVVIVNFVLNDVDFYTQFAAAKRFEERKDAEIGTLGLRIDPRLKRLLKSSAVIYFVKERVENLQGRLFGREQLDHYSRIWSSAENREKVRQGFARLAELRKEGRLDIVVVIWPLLADYTRYPFRWIHEWVGREAAAAKLPVIDLLETFSRVPYRELQVTAEDNVHPNAVGHRLAVDAFLARRAPDCESPSREAKPTGLRSSAASKLGGPVVWTRVSHG
jgi:lysophospholipase L1-like esterase